MKRFSLLILVVFLFVTFGAATVSAQSSDNACWGVVTAQLAQSEVGIVGEHSSTQAEPRDGLGNLLRLLGFDHISDFGAFLAEIDGIDATSCD